MGKKRVEEYRVRIGSQERRRSGSRNLETEKKRDSNNINHLTRCCKSTSTALCPRDS